MLSPLPPVVPRSAASPWSGCSSRPSSWPSCRWSSTFLEYQNIKKALVRAVSASGANNPEAIRSAFDRSQAIDDFHAIDSSKLVFSKDQGEQMTVSFKYSKDIPLFGPVKLVIDYEGDARAR